MANDPSSPSTAPPSSAPVRAPLPQTTAIATVQTGDSANETGLCGLASMGSLPPRRKEVKLGRPGISDAVKAEIRALVVMNGGEVIE